MAKKTKKPKKNHRVEKYGEGFEDMLREARVSKMHKWFMTLVDEMRKG